jgi:hypothetical protein
MLNYSKLNDLGVERLIDIYQDDLITPKEREKVETIIQRKLQKKIDTMHGDLWAQAMIEYYLKFNIYRTVKPRDVRFSIFN